MAKTIRRRPIPQASQISLLAENEIHNGETLADHIASYRGALTARELSEILSISAVTVFKLAKRGTASLFSSRQSRAILPARWKSFRVPRNQNHSRRMAALEVRRDGEDAVLCLLQNSIGGHGLVSGNQPLHPHDHFARTHISGRITWIRPFFCTQQTVCELVGCMPQPSFSDQT